MSSATRTPYLKTCPVGCIGELEKTDIVLPEGALLRCPACKQLISQCSETQYWKSMEEFNDPRGTLPSENSQNRNLRRSGKFLHKLSSLLDQSPGNTRLLDVGCSSGAFLNAAVKLGYQAEGVEPAEKAAATAKAAGLKVHQGLLHDAAYPDGRFEAVTLLEVIEHLNDPLPVLQECHRILKPGGILLIGTANAASWTTHAFKGHWDYFSIARHGGHVSFFNPQSLEKLAGQAGFALALLKTRSVRFCDRDNSSKPVYTLLKIIAELSNPLAAIFDKGSDMAIYLRRI